MAFVFPDPNTFPEFEAPNGITYRWDATDQKWVVGSFSDSDTVQCIGNTGTSDTQACKYKRLGDEDGGDTVRGDNNGPGQIANFKKLIFGSNLDTSLLKVGGRFNLAKGTQNNYFRVTEVSNHSNSKTHVSVSSLSTDSGEFYYEDNLKFSVLDLPAVQGDCLKCDPEKDETICEAIDSIRNDIVELEEEIEAIAPSVERGFWTMNLLGTVANQGQMSLYDDNYTNVGSPTGLFKDAKSIWLNEKDNSGTPHGFAGVEAGELIELFVQGADEYGLYEVVDVHDETNGATQWWVIEVNFVRTLEDTSTADNGDIIRVKIFNAPSGGSADEFVKKTGDAMSGDLKLDSESDASTDYDPNQVTAKLTFRNTKTDGTKSYINLWKNGHGGYLNCDKSYRTDGGFYAAFDQPFGARGVTHGVGGTIAKPNIRFKETSGGLYYGSETSDTDQYKRFWVNDNGTFAFAGTSSNSGYMFYLKKSTETGYLTHDGSYSNPCAYWGVYSGKKYFAIYNGLRLRTTAGGSNQGTGSSGQVPTADGNGGIYWKTPSTSTTTNYVKTESADYNASIKIYRSGNSYYITGGAA